MAENHIHQVLIVRRPTVVIVLVHLVIVIEIATGIENETVIGTAIEIGTDMERVLHVMIDLLEAIIVVMEDEGEHISIVVVVVVVDVVVAALVLITLVLDQIRIKIHLLGKIVEVEVPDEEDFMIALEICRVIIDRMNSCHLVRTMILIHIDPCDASSR